MWQFEGGLGTKQGLAALLEPLFPPVPRVLMMLVFPPGEALPPVAVPPDELVTGDTVAVEHPMMVAPARVRMTERRYCAAIGASD
jgi:hypothetical protein